MKKKTVPATRIQLRGSLPYQVSNVVLLSALRTSLAGNGSDSAPGPTPQILVAALQILAEAEGNLLRSENHQRADLRLSFCMMNNLPLISFF